MPRLSDVDFATDVAVLGVAIGGSGVVRSESFRRVIASALALQLESQGALQYSWASPAKARLVYRVRAGATSSKRALQQVLADLEAQPLSPRSATQRYSADWTNVVLDEAVDRGLLQRQNRTVARVWRRTVWTVHDTKRVTTLRKRIKDVLLAGAEPTVIDAVLIWLVARALPLSDVIPVPYSIDVFVRARSIVDRPWPELPAGTTLTLYAGDPYIRPCDGG